MSQNKKIVLIGTTAASVYGFRADFIKKLIASNCKVYAFVCEYADQDLEKIQSLGAMPITYKMNRGGLNPFADLKTIFELKNTIQSIQPDLVFSYFAKPAIYGTFAAKFSKVPKIIGMLEGLGYSFTDKPQGQSIKAKIIQQIQILLYKLALPQLDKIIFLNHDDPRDLVLKNKIKTKNNAVQVLGGIGLNLQDYPYSSWDENLPISFIFIARLLADKGIFEYIEAAKIVKQKYPNIIFTVIGGLDAKNPNGLTQNQLNILIKENIIEYHGFVNNVAEYIQSSAVFVLPSYREGVPRSTQEAMAIGRPVITTDVPGCRETVIDGVNGFFVPKWNSTVLAEKMIYFIENPNQVNIMGKASHEMAVEKFDADKVNQRLFEIIGITEK